ncbi:MAG: hypothetical protein ACMG6S_04370, partial [Byssovorax sp.]
GNGNGNGNGNGEDSDARRNLHPSPMTGIAARRPTAKIFQARRTATPARSALPPRPAIEGEEHVAEGGEVAVGHAAAVAIAALHAILTAMKKKRPELDLSRSLNQMLGYPDKHDDTTGLIERYTRAMSAPACSLDVQQIEMLLGQGPTDDERSLIVLSSSGLRDSAAASAAGARDSRLDQGPSAYISSTRWLAPAAG